MLPPKIAALCLCPVVAGPVVLATQPKARHAVAHVLHRVASSLDSPVAAREPLGHCPASYASAIPGGDGLSSGSPIGIAGLSPQDLSALTGSAGSGSAGSSSADGDGFRAFGSFAPRSGIGGSSSSTPFPPDGIGTPPTTPPVVAEGVTEPQNWALLMTGFALTGLAIRSRRPKAA